ncbi:hypothetical protein KR009_004827 [Drosophila setifemur]|nr:hypothetical protein KR009_004827 [Drosophila setifemur]
MSLISSNFFTSERTKAMSCTFDNWSPKFVRKIFELKDNAENTLKDPDGAQVLREYMEFRRSGDKNLAEQYLDVYEKCAVLLRERQRSLTKDEVDELVDMGLSRNKELELTYVLNKDRIAINQVLCGIQKTCVNEIWGSSDFRDFQTDVSKKWQNIKSSSCF